MVVWPLWLYKSDHDVISKDFERSRSVRKRTTHQELKKGVLSTFDILQLRLIQL